MNIYPLPQINALATALKIFGLLRLDSPRLSNFSYIGRRLFAKNALENEFRSTPY